MDAPHLAVVGGGQLARMMQQAAIGSGIRIRLLAEGPDVSAAQVVPDRLVGDHTVLADLERVCEGVAVVTFDHEHVPPEHLRALAAAGHAPRPGPHALLFAQDKAEMRARLAELGVPGPAHAVVADPQDLTDFAGRVGGFPVIVKTTRGGYDGKGVWKVDAADEAAEAFASGRTLIAEELVDFRRELSAQVARRPSGEVVAYPVVQSRQDDGICREVIAPAPDLDAGLAAQAEQIARTLAVELDVVGMLAVELFETSDGRVLVNELAMRPHNTGHWSIDGSATSQFENHLRAVLDLPLGPTAARAPWSVMVNVLGGSVTDLEAQLAEVLAQVPEARVHLYGKAVRSGRKVGHVTVVGDDLDQVRSRARLAADLLENG
ncbi:phosphoribosylaminoimidazole carboxylase, ATPase subunit [Aeromicrobium marinum DSM 15272]|uniref:N5-carboxyaminoimidazole ribonucleotide synthase n=1 Tax=Aeromicrobium marinum DSM 15272 TaxID=585531 RepID=E2SDM7_9ACTN|nr:5-(carboxyamino)imidazole ribonucleotide synthase [Aeromicrobium marinum]EFQ82604.1 phosphoribosylaminoimidazole carboxylase, ATPase subunit [Aeromicrobium marinum DSM 15272]